MLDEERELRQLEKEEQEAKREVERAWWAFQVAKRAQQDLEKAFQKFGEAEENLRMIRRRIANIRRLRRLPWPSWFF